MTRFLPHALLVTVLLLGSTAVASAQWTAVGSTGTVDNVDLSIFDMANSIIQVKAGAPLPANLNVRFNVVGVEFVDSPGDGISLRMRFRDNGAEARVLAMLKQVNFTTGVVTTLLTLDSNSVSGSTAFQTQTVGHCMGNPIDFSNNGYFVDVVLTKSGMGGTPALQLLSVSGNLC